MAKKLNPILSKFGDHLRKIRTQKQLSQTQLAFETGLTREYINRLENGSVNISLLNIIQIAEVLDILPTALLDFEKTF